MMEFFMAWFSKQSGKTGGGVGGWIGVELVSDCQASSELLCITHRFTWLFKSSSMDAITLQCDRVADARTGLYG